MAGNSIKWLQQFPSSDQLVTSWPRHRNTSCLSRVTCHNYHETFVRVMSVSQSIAQIDSTSTVPLHLHDLSSFNYIICSKILNSVVLFWIWPCVLFADRLACNKICIKLYDKKVSMAKLLRHVTLNVSNLAETFGQQFLIKCGWKP